MVFILNLKKQGFFTVYFKKWPARRSLGEKMACQT
jgi:hypothetical protein